MMPGPTGSGIHLQKILLESRSDRRKPPTSAAWPKAARTNRAALRQTKDLRIPK